MTRIKFNSRVGLSLAEILISLLVLSGSLGMLLGGIEIAGQLEGQGKFEEKAAFFAERELELAKTDFLRGSIRLSQKMRPGRFRLPSGWESILTWTIPDDFGIISIHCQLSYRKINKLDLETHLYLPGPFPEIPSDDQPRGNFRWL